MQIKPKAIALLSGGPDSALAAIKTKEMYETKGAFFNVGQPGAESQLAAARRAAAICGIHLEVFDISSLKNNFLGLAPGNEIAVSLTGRSSMNCPFGIFGLAASYAIASGASTLITGVHKDDLESAPHSLTYLRNVGVDASKLHKVDFEVALPFTTLTKTEVFHYGASLNFPFQVTRSCSSSSHLPCGICEECTKRLSAFAAAGIHDPADYKRQITKT